MLKFFMYCMLLWHGVCVILAQNEFNEDFKQNNNESNEQSSMNEWLFNEVSSRRTYRARVQVFNIIDQGGLANLITTDVCLRSYCRRLSRDDNTTNGKSEFKLHLQKLPWNGARKICDEKGGHLAVPRTDSEETEILKMMLEDSVDDAWLGIHDQFSEGDWVTVLDEPLAITGWAKWSKLFPNNPDNYNGNQHCARIVKNGGGMDDDVCELRKSFVCEMLTL